MNAKIGFNLPWIISCIIGGVLTLAFGAALIAAGTKSMKSIQ